MKNTKSRASRALALTFGLVLTCGSLAFAQDNPTGQAQGTDTASQSQGMNNTAQARTVASGVKAKLKGTIVERDPDTFTVRDDAGGETVVMLTDRTDVKSKGGFFRRGTNYDVTNLLRGLVVEVEGRGNEGGQLVAEKIRFDRQDLKVARSIESRVNPVEGRLGEVEAQNKTLSGQVDELNEVSKEIRGEADRANAGVASANERISALDDYDVQDQTAVYFKVNSAVLTPEGKTSLDELAQKAMATKGYVIEVAGFADSTGNVEKNRILSQRRADAVVRYLQENHEIPLRRMITPYGYGAIRPVADNTTAEGRQQNRRVEVKILVNRGVTQQAAS
jgi:outer membrane protein OmpA-like peptidoglycan-associated protein/uncharacterized protein YdeI (BOF family)